MKTNIYLSSYLAHCFLECEMFQTKVVEETQYTRSIACVPKIVPFMI